MSIKSKSLFLLLSSFLAFSSCQKKDDAPKSDVNAESDITADVLSKVSSKVEYKSRESVITIYSDGSYKLKFDGIVEQYAASFKVLDRDEAHCILNLAGKISFSKPPSDSTDARIRTFTHAKMTLTFASVESSSSTPNTKEGTDPHELCRQFANEAFEQDSFENNVLSFDKMAIVFPGIYFDVKNKNQNTAGGVPYKYRAILNTGIADDYDIIRQSHSLTYFVKSDGDVDITEMMFSDLKGQMTELKSGFTAVDLQPLEITIDTEKDMKVMTLSQNECQLNYTYYFQSARVKTDGVNLKLVHTEGDDQIDRSNPACLELVEKLKPLGAVTKVSYANQTRNENQPENYLKFYFQKSNGSIETLRFKSK